MTHISVSDSDDNSTPEQNMVRADRVDSHRPFEICGAAADAVRSLSVRFALRLGRLLISASTPGCGLDACRT
jgi:hypothetical protein